MGSPSGASSQSHARPCEYMTRSAHHENHMYMYTSICSTTDPVEGRPVPVLLAAETSMHWANTDCSTDKQLLLHRCPPQCTSWVFTACASRHSRHTHTHTHARTHTRMHTHTHCLCYVLTLPCPTGYHQLLPNYVHVLSLTGNTLVLVFEVDEPTLPHLLWALPRVPAHNHAPPCEYMTRSAHHENHMYMYTSICSTTDPVEGRPVPVLLAAETSMHWANTDCSTDKQLLLHRCPPQCTSWVFTACASRHSRHTHTHTHARTHTRMHTHTHCLCYVLTLPCPTGYHQLLPNYVHVLSLTGNTLVLVFEVDEPTLPHLLWALPRVPAHNHAPPCEYMTRSAHHENHMYMYTSICSTTDPVEGRPVCC